VPPDEPAVPADEGVVPAPLAGAGVLAAGAAAAVLLAAAGAAAAEVVELVLLDEWCVVEDAAAALVIGAEFGTVKGGAPAVLVVFEPAVPQAATPMEMTAAAARTAGLGLRCKKLIQRVAGTLRSRAAPRACRSRDSR
jgi:hypothetical protein